MMVHIRCRLRPPQGFSLCRVVRSALAAIAAAVVVSLPQRVVALPPLANLVKTVLACLPANGPVLLPLCPACFPFAAASQLHPQCRRARLRSLMLVLGGCQTRCVHVCAFGQGLLLHVPCVRCSTEARGPAGQACCRGVCCDGHSPSRWIAFSYKIVMQSAVSEQELISPEAQAGTTGVCCDQLCWCRPSFEHVWGSP